MADEEQGRLNISIVKKQYSLEGLRVTAKHNLIIHTSLLITSLVAFVIDIIIAIELSIYGLIGAVAIIVPAALILSYYLYKDIEKKKVKSQELAKTLQELERGSRLDHPTSGNLELKGKHPISKNSKAKKLSEEILSSANLLINSQKGKRGISRESLQVDTNIKSKEFCVIITKLMSITAQYIIPFKKEMDVNRASNGGTTKRIAKEIQIMRTKIVQAGESIEKIYKLLEETLEEAEPTIYNSYDPKTIPSTTRETIIINHIKVLLLMCKMKSWLDRISPNPPPLLEFFKRDNEEIAQSSSTDEWVRAQCSATGAGVQDKISLGELFTILWQDAGYLDHAHKSHYDKYFVKDSAFDAISRMVQQLQWANEGERDKMIEIISRNIESIKDFISDLYYKLDFNQELLELKIIVKKPSELVSHFHAEEIRDKNRRQDLLKLEGIIHEVERSFSQTNPGTEIIPTISSNALELQVRRKSAPSAPFIL